MQRFILSIDGGGIRGIIPTAVLVELEKKLIARGKKLGLHRYFHLIAGTSTGAIVTAGLACPHPDKPSQPASSPKALLDLYMKQGSAIFDTGLFRKFANLGGVLDEHYSADALEKILIKMLGPNSEIKDALTKVLITGYDIHARTAVFMTNADHEHERFLFWQAVRGSSAAPTYFEPALVDNLASKAGGKVPTIPLIDGGVFANDPAMAAYIEGRKMGWAKDTEELVVLSLGTGTAHRPIPYQKAKTWGAGGWINPADDTPLISVFMQGQASTTGYQLNRILNETPPKFVDGATVVTAENRKALKYFRINAALTGDGDGVGRANDALDDASEKNLIDLLKFGQALAARHDLALEEIADRLEAI